MSGRLCNGGHLPGTRRCQAHSLMTQKKEKNNERRIIKNNSFIIDSSISFDHFTEHFLIVHHKYIAPITSFITCQLNLD